MIRSIAVFRFFGRAAPLILGLGAGLAAAEGSRPEIYRLANSDWLVEVAPELGGKLVGLTDRRTGREWLWSRDEGRELTAPTPGSGFGVENLLGMDEILPSLKKEEWSGRRLPGHGEVWRSPLEVSEADEAGTVIETVLDLESLPLRYTRRVELEGPTVRMHYRLENLSGETVPFLWALHPLFDLREGDRMDMTLAEPELLVKAAPGLRQLSAGDRFDWPGGAEGLDLTGLDLGDRPKAGIKFLSRSPPDGIIELDNPGSGARLRVRYDVDSLPWLAVWLSRGVWGGAHHIALEPTNRPGESIGGTGEDTHPTGLVGPGESRDWWVEFTNASERPRAQEQSAFR